MNTGQFTYLSETSTTMFGAHTATVSHFLVFYPYRKVSRFISVRHFILIKFPIADKEHSKHDDYRKFRRQLFHTSLETMLLSLKPQMTKPEPVRCPDGHFRRAVLGLGPYIADYPEQAILACIVQGWCPK